MSESASLFQLVLHDGQTDVSLRSSTSRPAGGRGFTNHRLYVQRPSSKKKRSIWSILNSSAWKTNKQKKRYQWDKLSVQWWDKAIGTRPPQRAPTGASTKNTKRADGEETERRWAVDVLSTLFHPQTSERRQQQQQQRHHLRISSIIMIIIIINNNYYYLWFDRINWKTLIFHLKPPR